MKKKETRDQLTTLCATNKNVASSNLIKTYGLPTINTNKMMVYATNVTEQSRLISSLSLK